MRRDLADKRIKEALVDRLLEGVDLGEIVDWLWEDFGIRVRRDRRAIKRAIVRSQDVTPQDIAVFMIENGVEVDEGAWRRASDPV